MSNRQLTEKQRTLYRLADFICERQDVRLNMGVAGLHECGTVGCIAGFAALMLEMPDPASEPTPDIGAQLGLSTSESRALFFPPTTFPGSVGWRATREEAATVIRHFARTGTIDWSLASATSEGE